jgi:hypothetical protein
MSKNVTHWLERCHFTLSGRHVVDNEATLRFSSVLVVEQITVRNLRYALVCPVLRLEIQIGCPVVRQLSQCQHRWGRTICQ